MTIRKRVLMSLVCFAVIPILIVTGVGLLANIGTIEKLYMNRLGSLAQMSASALSEILTLYKDKLIHLSESREVSDYANTRAAQEEAGTAAAAATANLDTYLENYLLSAGIFDDVIILDGNGMLSAGYNSGQVQTDHSDMDYFYRVIEKNDPQHVFVSEVHSSFREPEDPAKNCLAFSRVILDRNGAVQGVLVGFAATDMVVSFARDIHFGETGVAFVIDSDNFILYHPESRFFNTYTNAEKLSNLLDRYQAGEIPESGAIYDMMGGSARIYYYVVIADEELILLLRQDHDELTKDRLHMLTWAIGTLIAAILLAIPLAMRFSRGFVTPILKLKDAFASGKDEGRYVVCNLESNDELGDMADNYNIMIQTLERQFEEISDEKRNTEYTALHDSVTGLFNRIAFEHRLSRAICGDEMFGVLFLDLDDFKQVNDVLGHSFGDSLLCVIGQRISAPGLGFEMVARIGGDEFLLLKRGDAGEIEAAAQRLIEALRTPFKIDTHTVRVTSSVGVATYPADGKSVGELVKSADIAMYRSKDSGKDTISFYNKEMQHRIYRYSQILNVLHSCIENDEVSLAYQPEIELETRKTVTYEALMRINSKELGPISPAEFIPIAESDNAIINRLGHWSLVTACRFVKRLIEEQGFEGKVAVNISVVQLKRDDFVDEVLSVLKEENLPARHLQFELTESILMSDMKNNARKLALLRENGVSVAMDDFGTHYSSFSYLIHLPLDILKIDRSFSIDIETNDKVLYINSTIINLAHKLGLRVVAEGVETEAQYELIRNAGGDIIQGYYFSRPLQENDAVKWLEDEKVPL